MSVKKFDLIIDKKIQPYNRVIQVDSDKSLSIRSFLIGAICQNISSTKNVLESEDVLSTIKCLSNLGVKIKKKIPDLIIFMEKDLVLYSQRKVWY